MFSMSIFDFEGKDKMSKEFGYNYDDCHDCKYYVSYHPCNRCYEREHLRNKWYKNNKPLPGRLPYIPYAAGEDDDW